MPNFKIVRDDDGTVIMTDVVDPPENKRHPMQATRAEKLEAAENARKGIKKTPGDALVENLKAIETETLVCQHCDFTTERPTALLSHTRHKHPEEEGQ